MYGCGSTEHGELPYLRSSSGGGDSDLEEDATPRSEICVPTRMRLPFLQVLPLLARAIEPSPLQHACACQAAPHAGVPARALGCRRIA